MNCNTCKPNVIIETGCTPRPTATQQCGCKPEVEPVCASYADVRKMVTNWLYDLDTSVGFGKTMENFVKKSIMTGIQSNDTTMLDLKNAIKEALLNSIKAETDTYTETKLETKFNDVSARINQQFSGINTELGNLANVKKQELTDTVTSLLNSAKTDLASKLQKSLTDISGTAGEIQAAATAAKTQIDNKVESAIDRVTTKVDLLGQQLDFKVSQGLQDLNNVKTSVISEINTAKADVERVRINALQDLTHLKDDAVNDLELVISQAKQDFTNVIRNIETARDDALAQIRAEKVSLEQYKTTLDAKLAEVESALARIKLHNADVELTDGTGETLHTYAHSETTRN